MSSGTEGGGEGIKPKRARRRPNPSPPSDLVATVNDLLSHPRLQPEFRAREAPADAELRRKKEFLSLLIKDLSPFALAILFLFAMGVYSFAVLLNPKASPESLQRAWSALTTVLSGVVSFIFGKAAGK